MNEDLKDIEQICHTNLSNEEDIEEPSDIIGEQNEYDKEEEPLDDLSEEVVEGEHDMSSEDNEETEPIIHKNVDIYVENDISELDRMLGIKHDTSISDDIDNVDLESDIDEEDAEDESSTSLYDTEDKSYNNEDVKDSKEGLKESLIINSGSTEDKPVEADVEISKDNHYDDNEVVIYPKEFNTQKEQSVVEPKLKKALLHDFMYDDKDVFSFLNYTDNAHTDFSILSIPVTDTRALRKAVSNKSLYIYRYPKLQLKDAVLGFHESAVSQSDSMISYSVYFPEYIIRFSVPSEHKKIYSVSFKDYFENLVSHIRPNNLTIEYLKDSLSIQSIKVIETGVIEVSTDDGVKTLCIKEKYNCLSFYMVLSYIREESDRLPNKALSLPLLKEYFYVM